VAALHGDAGGIAVEGEARDLGSGGEVHLDELRDDLRAFSFVAKTAGHAADTPSCIARGLTMRGRGRVDTDRPVPRRRRAVR